MSKEIEVLSAVHGIAPRSDELLKLGADLERGRVAQESYDERLAQESADWLSLQAEAGIDIRENGKLRWQDHLRPIVKAATGFAPDVDDAPVTRWYETNTFYRQPTITGRLSLDYAGAEREIPVATDAISLITPATFASLCRDEYPELPAERNVIQLYSDLLFYLQSKGVKRVTFEHYANDPKNLFKGQSSLERFEQLGDWHSDLQLGLIDPYGRPLPLPLHRPKNLGLEVDNTSLRHIARVIPPDFRPELAGTEIWQAVVHTATTGAVARSAEDWPLEALAELSPARLVLTHTVDAERLPLYYAKDKILKLGELATQLSARLEAEL